MRDAVSGDEGSIRHVVETVLREHGLDTEPDGIDADLEDVVASYQDRGGVFRVLVDDAGEIVGCGGLYPLTGVDAEIRKMYFLPRARGLGHGRRLLEELIARARAGGFERIVLETASRLTTAAALYRRFGFVDTTRDHLAGRADTAMVLDLR
jgi:putative acetyltransferase